jgi:hypothetical protein
MGQAVFDINASQKIHFANERLFSTWGKTAEQLADQEKQRWAIADEVTAEDFKKALMSRLLKVANLKTGSVKTPWGQFPDTIPRKYYI